MQANREIVYYTLVSSAQMWEITKVADMLDMESFTAMGFDQKWQNHLWIPENNKCFLEFIGKQNDLQKVDRILSEQLKLYARKHNEGYEKNKGDYYIVYKARKDWLRHTIFIFKNEYNKTKNEIFAEVVMWCEEYQRDWLELDNPYSPEELTSFNGDLKIPLWQRLAEENNEMPEANPFLKGTSEAESTKIKPQSLLQVWSKKKGEEHYKKVIEYLKDQDRSPLQTPFVIQDETGQLNWLPNNQYLGAFLKRCIALGFVDKTITSKEWVQIFNRTFNLEIAPNSDKPFQPKRTFQDTFTDPFNNLSHL